MFSHSVSLAEGVNPITLVALDASGNIATAELAVVLDSVAPAAPDPARVFRTFPEAGLVTVAGNVASVEANATVRISNTASGASVSVLANGVGVFSAQIAAANDDLIGVLAIDTATNESAQTLLGRAAAPELTLNPIGDQVAPLGHTLRFTVTALDGAGGSIELGVTPVPLPPGARLDLGSGEFTYDPQPEQVGTLSLTFSASTATETRRESIDIEVPAPLAGALTSMTGRVLDANSLALSDTVAVVGATISFLGTGVSTTTDAQGFFTLLDIPAGELVFAIDASSANPAPDGAGYASFREALSLVAGVDNVIERAFTLPRVATQSLTPVVPGHSTKVENPTLGITLTVAPDTAVNADGSPFTGELSISEVPPGLAPAALPAFLEPTLLITIQPAGVRFLEPVPITFPNIDNLPAGSEVDIWSLDPDAGEFTIVGVGEVSADGASIVTVSGGIRAADWHLLIPPLPFIPTFPLLQNPHNPCPSCPEEQGSSTFSLHDGHMGLRFTLPAYRSLEASRALTFSYRSFRAYPRPSIAFNGEIPVRSAVPPTVSYHLSVAGLAQGEETYVSTAGFSEGADEPFRGAVVFDGRDFASGMYAYRLRMTSNFASGARVSTLIDNEVMVVNEQDSAFGAGWMLEGLHRLALNANASATLLTPAGNSINYRPDSVADTFITPDNDYATFVRNADGTYTHTEKDGTRMHFDASGLMSAHEDRNANTTSYAYDDENRLEILTDPVGLVTTFDYGPDGKLAAVTDPGARVSRFDYDLDGNLVKLTYPDATFQTYEYDERHLMTAHIDERGNRYSDRYDGFGRIIDGTLPDGTVRAAAGQTSVGLVDLTGGAGTESNPATITRPDAVQGDYVDGRGNASMKALDSHGRATLEMDELGRTTAHQRDADSNPTRTTRPIGSVVTRTFDAQGNVLTEREEFNGATTTYRYDGFSLVTSVTNARAHTTTIERDALGNPSAIVNHLGHTTTMDYDPRGLVVRTVSPNQLETVYTYNGEGLMARKTETPPAGSPGNVRVSQYSYHATGLLAQVITPEQIVLAYTYDERSRLSAVSDNLGQSIAYVYDAHGNVVQSETRSGDASLALVVSSVFDNRNRLVETRAPHVGVEESITERVLDENSNLVGLVDPNGAMSSNLPFNRLAENTHRLDGITTYGYDDQDRIVQVIAPNGATTHYTYDIIGRRLSETSPDRGTLAYTYDPANNVLTVTEGRGITATMGYDELERVVSKTYPNTIAGKTEDVTYVYDSCLFGLGMLCMRTDESGQYDYAYDAYGNLSTVQFTESGGVAYTSAYEYDDGDRTTRMTMPSGRVVDYTRDAVRRIEAIDTTVAGFAQTIISAIQYRGDNQVTQCTFGNGLIDERSYDLQGRLTHQVLKTAADSTLDERTYAYDKNSNILSIETGFEDNAYAYDALDRLTRDAIDANPANDYTYDLNDNRLTEALTDASHNTDYTYEAGTNRLLARTIHEWDSSRSH